VLIFSLLFMQFFKLIFFNSQILLSKLFIILFLFGFFECDEILFFEVWFCNGLCTFLGFQVITETLGVGAWTKLRLVAVCADVEESVGFTHVPWRLLIKLRFGTVVKSKFFVRKSFIHYVCLILAGTGKPSGLWPLLILIVLLHLLFLYGDLLHGFRDFAQFS
jgi:hypothetical protein